MSKHRFIIDCTSDEFQPHVTMHGPAAAAFALHLLGRVRITRLSVENMDEPVIGDVADEAAVSNC